MPEYKAWLGEVERRNSHKTWQQTITFLHREHQTGDEDLGLPLLGNTFVNGPENDGWQDRNFDTACYANTPTGKKERRTPYYVVDEFGRLIDLTHIYAGIRSDFNRDRNSWKADFMRRANTDWGDRFQDIAMPKAWTWPPGQLLPVWQGGYAPPKQLLGDAIGIRASDILRGLKGGPWSWAGVILQAIEESVREEAFARDVADLLPTEDVLTSTSEPPTDAAEEERQKAAREAERKRKDALCDPSNNPSKRTKGTVNEDGFIAMTEDYGAPVEPAPGCEPYGPPAKRFEYEGPEERAADKEPVPIAPRCAEFGNAVDAAGSQYAKGEVKAAKAALEGVLAQLDESSGCPDVRTRVIGNLGKIKRLTDVVASLDDGLKRCEPAALRYQHEQLADATHVKLIAAREQLLRAVPVAERYAQATLAYKEGRIDDAASLFRTALTKAEEAQAPTCVDIEKRTRSNLGRIDQMRELERVVSGVLDQCDMTAIEQRKAQLLGSTNPFLIKLHTRLSNPPARCTQEVASRQCADQYGSGWRAGPADDKGNFFCRPPNETAANQWCENNNEGSGWVAGDVQANGSFGCYPS